MPDRELRSIAEIIDRGCSPYRETGDIAEAERLYRVLMKCDPTDAAPPFNLGNMLRANGRMVEAEAVFRAATRADPLFAEAWYNLADLLDEQGRSEAAIDCLRGALRAEPDYADATFNLALLLQRGNKHAEAAEYWRRYLAKDGKSEWAARARRSLKFCEMQMHLSASQTHCPFKRLLGSDAGGGKAGSGRGLGPIRERSPIPQHHGHGTSPMSPREPQHTPPKTLAMQSSRDMLEKLRRE